MGARYCVTHSNDAGSGDNVWVELVAASGISVGIYKINVALTATPADTMTGRVRVFRETTAATNLTAATIVDMNPGGPAPTTTANIKQTGVFGASGTVTDVLLDCAVHLRQTFEWSARDKDNYLWSSAGGRLICRLVNLNSAGIHLYNVYFTEEG
jgi:hypothetical protein